MLPPDERERIRRAYSIEKKSIVRIAQEEGHSCESRPKRMLMLVKWTFILLSEA